MNTKKEKRMGTTHVECATIECKYNHDCVCTKKSINLSNHLIHTMYEGVQGFWRCKDFEKSEEAKRIEQMWKELLKGRELPTT